MLEVCDRFLKSVRGVAAELADADIADPAGLELRFDRFDPDDLSRKGDVEWLLLAAQDGERHGRSGIAPQQAHDLAQAHPLRARLVDHDNLVTRFESGMSRRRPVDRRDDLGYSVLFGNLHAEPAKAAGNVCLGLRELLRIHVVGMRVKAAEHSLKSIFAQLVRADRMHVIALNELNHTGKQGEIRSGRFGVLHRDGNEGYSGNACRYESAHNKRAKFRHHSASLPLAHRNPISKRSLSIGVNVARCWRCALQIGLQIGLFGHVNLRPVGTVIPHP